MVDTADWQADVLRLKGEGVSANDIAEQVGKHVATVRKVIARNPVDEAEVDAIQADIERTAQEEGERVWEPNGNGHGPLDHDTAERLREAAGFDVAGAGYEPDEPIPGQIDIEGSEVPSHEDLHGNAGGGGTLDAFKEEAGEAVGAMPPREMDAGEITHVEEIRVDGSTQFAFDCGGRSADDGTLTLSGSVNVDGFYRKGDRIYGTFEAVVTGVAVKDKLDKKTGVVKDTGQSHVAKVAALVVNGWKN